LAGSFLAQFGMEVPMNNYEHQLTMVAYNVIGTIFMLYILGRFCIYVVGVIKDDWNGRIRKIKPEENKEEELKWQKDQESKKN